MQGSRFRPKSLKVRNTELGGVYTCLLNEAQRKHALSGGSGGSPPENVWSLGSQMVHSSGILGHCTPIPLPPPLQKNVLFRFTLISRMAQGVGKNSEIRLKSEDSVPWASLALRTFRLLGSKPNLIPVTPFGSFWAHLCICTVGS